MNNGNETSSLQKLKCELMLFYFNCNQCGKPYKLEDLYNYLETEKEYEIEQIVDNSFNTYFEVMRGESIFGGPSDLKIQFPFTCEFCQKTLSMDLLIEFSYSTPDFIDYKTVSHLEQIDEICIIDIEGTQLNAIPGLYEGKEIWRAIFWLILRWALTQREIFVITPFIDKDGWEKIANIGKILLELRQKNSKIKKMVTRTMQNFYKTSAKSLLHKVMSEFRIDKCMNLSILESGECHCCNEICHAEGLHHILESYLVSSSNFHAKLLAGKSDENVELVVTSFNLVERELNQIESFSFLKISPNQFENQMKNFEKLKCNEIKEIEKI